MTTRLLLDCDPGHDDAIAILLAAGSPLTELLAVTTVAGNQTLDKTTRNALAVATIARLDGVPVVAGHDRPLVRELHTAAAFHGETGLDGPDPVLPDRAAAPGHAVETIIDTLTAVPGEVALVATGPLTNVAAALRREPAIAEAVSQVVIMGGAYGRGNVTQTAEFNIYVDPEAAAVVFGAPWRVTMIGLDLTHQAGCSEEVQRRIAALGTRAGAFTDAMLTFFRAAYRSQAGLSDPPIHDACAVAFAAAPELFETRPAAVEVELAGRRTAGTTVVDFGPDDAEHRHRVAVRIDAPALFELIVDALVCIG